MALGDSKRAVLEYLARVDALLADQSTTPTPPPITLPPTTDSPVATSAPIPE